MRRSIVVLVCGLLAAGLAGCLHTPMPWSPDSSWIAYTVEVRPPNPADDLGWMFDPERPIRPARSGLPTSYRLWATRPTTGASVLLEEAAGPITSPGWSADGRALAFGRVVANGSGANRFEVVVMEGLSRRRVIATEPLATLDAESSKLPNQAIVWSPDGRYLAVPHLNPMGLAILRADNGRLVQTIPDAFLPSWSPTGGRLAFFTRTGSSHLLNWIDSALGETHPLIDVGTASQAPAWTLDGMSVLVVSRRLSLPVPVINRRGPIRPDILFRAEPATGDVATLVRVRVDSGALEVVHSLLAEPHLGRNQTIEGTSITADRDAENFFGAISIAGRPSQVTWFQQREGTILKKFPIIDEGMTIGSLALAPDGQTLAARVAAGDQPSPPLFCDIGGNTFRVQLAVPDDAARIDWIIHLERTARNLLTNLPHTRVQMDGKPTLVGRPTVFPLLADLTDNSELGSRLRRIGQLGRPLCDRPTDAQALDPTAQKLIDEARLFFDIIREDYTGALRSLETLELDATTPERRVALLTVRAQVLLNKGEFRSALRTIGLLNEADRAVPRRVEWTGKGYQMTEEAVPGQGWPRFLQELVHQTQAKLVAGDREDANPGFNQRNYLFRALPGSRTNPRLPLDDEPPGFRPNVPRVFVPPGPGQ